MKPSAFAFLLPANRDDGLYIAIVMLPSGILALILFLILGHLWVSRWKRRFPLARIRHFAVEIVGFLTVPPAIWLSQSVREDHQLYGLGPPMKYAYHTLFAVIVAAVILILYLRTVARSNKTGV